MKKTTKIQNLKNYLLARCKDYKEHYSYQSDINTFEDAKIMIQKIFIVEKLKNKNLFYSISNYQKFIDWICGLCFCSPIMEDLKSFTRCTNRYNQEQDVCNKIYQLVLGTLN